MPFLALAAPLIGGALGLGATATAAVGAGLGIAGGLVQNNQNKQNANSATSPTQVNIDQLNQQVKQISQQNALDSANLEKQLTPEVPQLRTAANNAILGGIAPSAQQTALEHLLSSNLTGNSISAPLLQQAIAKASSDLSLGGKLGTDQQNFVTRQALAHAGAIGGGGLGLGRDLSARDLGLSSLGLEQQRLQTALGAGSAQQGLSQANATDLTNRESLLAQLNQSNFSRALAAGQYGQNIQQPNVGLDPSAAANIAIGNNNVTNAANANRANIYGQQANNNANVFGSLLGFANTLSGFNGGGSGTQFNSTYGNPTQTSSYFGNYNPGGK